jgi:hypothetical protein
MADEGEKLVIATEIAPAPVAEVVQTHQPTLLESAVAVPLVAEVKPAEEVVREEAKTPTPVAEEAKPPVVAEAKEEAKPPVVEETPKPVEKPDWAKIEFPETIKATPEQVKQIGEIFDGILAPKEGETPLHAAQRLLGMHGEAMQAYAKKVEQDQWKVWNDYNDEQRKLVMADPRIGGAGHQTAMRAIARVRDRMVSDHEPGTKGYEADAKEYEDFLKVTGAGNHRVHLRSLHRMARFIDEPAAPSFSPKPAPNNGSRPGGRSLYSNSNK